MAKKQWDRKTAVVLLVNALNMQQIRELCSIINTAEVQGDYHFDGEGSTWQDDVHTTLGGLADELLKAKLDSTDRYISSREKQDNE